MEAALIVIFYLLGMTIASFLSVCIDRLPAGRSIVSPPSQCPTCHHRLGVRDLVPVFSYIFRRGRCRYCGAPIPKSLLWMELGVGALFAYLCWHYLYWQSASGVELAVALFYTSIFIVIAGIDWQKGLILNKLIFPAIIAALLISAAFSIFLPDIEIVPFIGRAAIGGGIGLVIFFLIVIISRGGLGWGDVKLALFIGLVTGYPLVFVALLIGVILGGLVAVILLLTGLKKRKEAIPFGPFLALATVVTLVWGSQILSWYRGLF